MAGGVTVAHRAALSLRAAGADVDGACAASSRPRARLMRALPFDAAAHARQPRWRASTPARSAPRRRRRRRPACVTADELGDARRCRRACRRGSSTCCGACRGCRGCCSCSRVLVVVLAVLAGGALLIVVGRRRCRGARGAVAAARAAGPRRSRRRTSCARRGQTPAAVDALPPSPDFALSRARRRLHADARRRPTARRRRGSRTRYATALAARGERRRPRRGRRRRRSSVAAIARQTVAALDPDVTIPRRTLHGHRAARPASSGCSASTFVRGHGLSADRPADVRAAQGHLRRAASCPTST